MFDIKKSSSALFKIETLPLELSKLGLPDDLINFFLTFPLTYGVLRQRKNRIQEMALAVMSWPETTDQSHTEYPFGMKMISFDINFVSSLSCFFIQQLPLALTE